MRKGEGAMPLTWRTRPRSHSSPPPRRRAATRRCRPGIEPLEDRCVPTALVALSTSNQLLGFDSSAPGTIQATLPITGLQPGESILDIDFRPRTGQLFGLGSSNRLYAINPSSGAAAQVGTGTFAVPLSGTAFGIDFDPVADRLRVVSNTGQNLRLNPDTGAVIDGDPNAPGTQPDATLNPPGDVVSIAYRNNFDGAATTTLYGIDAGSNMFVQIGGTDGNPSPDLGAVTPVAAVGADVSEEAGLDISPDNTGYASLTVGGTPQLVRISLTTGPAQVGLIGAGVGVRGLAVVILPPPPPPPPPAPGTLFALTRANQLLRFNTATPGTLISTTPVTGLQGGETLLGLDARPAKGQLYALGSTGRLYVIDPGSG